jgi:hypothetical protein
MMAAAMHADVVGRRRRLVVISHYLPSCAAKSWSLPLSEKTSSATSASQSTASSRAFFASPRRRFENVTCRLTLFSIRHTSTFPRPRPRPRPISGRPASRSLWLCPAADRSTNGRRTNGGSSDRQSWLARAIALHWCYL